jgi:hypothetical protein
MKTVEITCDKCGSELLNGMTDLSSSQIHLSRPYVGLDFEEHYCNIECLLAYHGPKTEDEIEDNETTE